MGSVPENYFWGGAGERGEGRGERWWGERWWGESRSRLVGLVEAGGDGGTRRRGGEESSRTTRRGKTLPKTASAGVGFLARLSLLYTNEYEGGQRDVGRGNDKATTCAFGSFKKRNSPPKQNVEPLCSLRRLACNERASVSSKESRAVVEENHVLRLALRVHVCHYLERRTA